MADPSSAFTGDHRDAWAIYENKLNENKMALEQQQGYFPYDSKPEEK